MSILILATQYKPNIGGIQTYLDDFTKFLAKNKYDVDVITFKPQPISRLFKTRMGPPDFSEKSSRIKVKRIGYVDLGISYLFPIRSVIEFFLILNLLVRSFIFMLSNNKSVKLIHSHDYVTGAVAFVLSKIFKKKWVMSHHSIFPYFKKSIRRYIGAALLRNADIIFANSETVKRQLELGLGKNRPKITVAHYWIDHKKFRPKNKLQSRKRLGLPEDAYLAMFVGRLEIAKGLGEFSKASKTADKDTYFVVAGSGEDQNVLEKYANPQLIYVGPKYGEDVVDCYNAADVCCFPTVAIEAFGRVSIEALSCGTPVIVSSTATKELIDDSVGLRTKPTANDISRNVKLAKKIFKSSRMEKLCREFSIKHYSESNGNMILKEYERLIKN